MPDANYFWPVGLCKTSPVGNRLEHNVSVKMGVRDWRERDYTEGNILKQAFFNAF